MVGIQDLFGDPSLRLWVGRGRTLDALLRGHVQTVGAPLRVSGRDFAGFSVGMERVGDGLCGGRSRAGYSSGAR